MRSQADIIATIIMVGVAVVIALGFMSYAIPLIVSARVEHDVAVQASRIGGSIDAAAVASANTSSGRIVVFSVAGRESVRLYFTVLGFKDNSPVEAPSIRLYSMSQPTAALNTSQGWTGVSSCSTVPGDRVRVYVQGGFYELKRLGLASVTVCDLGIPAPGRVEFYRVELPAAPGTVYLGVLMAEINGYYTSVLYFNTG